MDEEIHIVFAVDVAEFAVRMVWITHLVAYHGLLIGEMPVAIFVGALDLAHFV
jgi:hypothetical protein